MVGINHLKLSNKPRQIFWHHLEADREDVSLSKCCLRLQACSEIKEAASMDTLI